MFVCLSVCLSVCLYVCFPRLVVLSVFYVALFHGEIKNLKMLIKSNMVKNWDVHQMNN